MGIAPSVFVSPHDKLITKIFIEERFAVAYEPADADCIVFGGGADVHPYLYGEPIAKNAGVQCSIKRDLQDITLFKGVPKSKPKIGICRGAQFVNVMCGGKLFQNVDRHNVGDHKLVDRKTNKEHEVTSTHHQMMLPSADADIIAQAKEATIKQTPISTYTYKYRPKHQRFPDDHEVVWYEDFNALCFQPHPEYRNMQCRKYFFELIDRYFPELIKNRKD